MNRKHLPSIEDCSGLILRYGQTIGQNQKDTILPQDLLYQDLKVSYISYFYIKKFKLN